MQDNTLTITTQDGKEIVCDILFTYHSDEYNKDYVLFLPRGEEEVSAASYVETADGQGRLDAVETDEEWTMLENLLEDYVNSQADENQGCTGSCASCAGGCECSDDEECDCDGKCSE